MSYSLLSQSSWWSVCENHFRPNIPFPNSSSFRQNLLRDIGFQNEVFARATCETHWCLPSDFDRISQAQLLQAQLESRGKYPKFSLWWTNKILPIFQAYRKSFFLVAVRVAGVDRHLLCQQKFCWIITIIDTHNRYIPMPSTGITRLLVIV